MIPAVESRAAAVTLVICEGWLTCCDPFPICPVTFALFLAPFADIAFIFVAFIFVAFILVVLLYS